ncbi:MAG: ABC transporter substrate-binding protein [Promethearchaeota archaeon]
MKKLALTVLVLTLFFLILTPTHPLVLNQIFAKVFIPMKDLEEEWENKDITWYYENLLDDDRKKIRLAMDLAIPRQRIIDEIYDGHAELIATPIGKNLIEIYDQDISPRSYNPSMSLALLTEVFGKTYNEAIQNETYTTVPYFRMTLVSPMTNQARTQWVPLIAQSFRNIGIYTTLKWWNWNIIVPRLFFDPIETGYDYIHGGYDAIFMDQFASADPDYSSKFLRKAYVPTGNNYAWIENSVVEEIWGRTLNSSDPNSRIQGLCDFQKWFNDQVPMSIICQEQDMFIMDPKIKGFDTYLVGRGAFFNNCTIKNQTTMTYTIPVDFVNFNPLLSNYYSDSVVVKNIFLSLAARRGDYNLTHPVPLLAKNWESSSNGLEWIVTLRQGVQWHDGTEVTADDVVFSYHSLFNEELKRAPTLSFIEDRFGKNASASIKKLGTYTVKFTLQSFYPYMTTAVFGLPIIQKAQMEQIALKDWRTHETNHGKEKLIGCGPYEFESYNFDQVILVKSDNYNQAKIGHNPSATGGGIFWPNASIETIKVAVVKDAKTAIWGLERGKYDAIDPQTGIYENLDEINASNWAKMTTTLKYGWQELVYNQYSPIWGMNPGNPYKMYLYRPIPNLNDYMPTLIGYFLFFTSGVIVLVVVIIRTAIQGYKREF